MRGREVMLLVLRERFAVRPTSYSPPAPLLSAPAFHSALMRGQAVVHGNLLAFLDCPFRIDLDPAPDDPQIGIRTARVIEVPQYVSLRAVERRSVCQIDETDPAAAFCSPSCLAHGDDLAGHLADLDAVGYPFLGENARSFYLTSSGYDLVVEHTFYENL